MKKSILIRYIVLVVAALLAYGNTLFLKYASDDRMIIFENDYTLTGDVKSVMTKDAFTGFFGEDGKKLVEGGRYRPLPQLTFMAEYQAFGGDVKEKAGLHRAPQNEELFSNSALPYIQHGINVLYFILLCFVIYITLQKIFPQFENEKWYLSLPFLATLLFLVHPLHTEAVANIKGRDEIMSMLGAMLALLTALKFVESRKWWWLLLSFVAMLLGIFAKENAITFLAVIPLALLFKKTERKSDYLWTLLPALVASVIFIVVRSQVLGEASDTATNVLNNPFAEVKDKSRVIATVLFTWALYFKLLVFPHPLTHDYYPNQIEITDFGNAAVWLVILAVLAMAVYVIRVLVQIGRGKRKENHIFAFGIAFFFITFSITSNLLFNVGTFMNERFVFMPLLGFTLIVAFAFRKWAAWGVGVRQEMVKRRRLPAGSMPSWVTAPIAMVVVFLLLCTAYTGKTAVRNMAWKDDNTLFITDVETSSESMKCNLSAGGSYLNLYQKEHKEKYLKKAEQHLNKTLALGRSDTDTWSLFGRLYFFKKDYVNAARCYGYVLSAKPDDKDALANMALMRSASVTEANRLIDEGKRAEALALVQEAIKDEPNSAALLNILGRLSGEEAAAALAQAENALQANPDNAALQQTIQQKKKALQQSISYLERAHELDPDYASACENLGIAYASLHRFSEAIPLLERALELYTTEKDIERTRNNLEMMKQASVHSK